MFELNSNLGGWLISIIVGNSSWNMSLASYATSSLSLVCLSASKDLICLCVSSVVIYIVSAFIPNIYSPRWWHFLFAYKSYLCHFFDPWFLISDFAFWIIYVFHVWCRICSCILVRHYTSWNFHVVSGEWTGCFGQSSVFTNDEQWAKGSKCVQLF